MKLRCMERHAGGSKASGAGQAKAEAISCVCTNGVTALRTSKLSSASENRMVIEAALTSNLGRLRRFIQKYEHDPHCVEDLVQDTALEAIRCAGLFQGASRPEIWLFGIAHNIVRGHRQRMYRYRTRYVDLDDSAMELACVDVAPDLREALALKEAMAIVARCVDRMPEHLRLTFECMFVCGLRYQDIAKQLGIPIGTVRSRVARIRKLLSVCEKFTNTSK
ncbi:RNA polymerase sigma factor [Burkholderia cepacia]|uniref:RNA polymerase sigma factor n=1 Tax=Burkholderia cepacia TaxID=292 RepID=UPI0009BDF6D2|nr:sigma-70 family RNA polymerase sigma factor [Burkholderia cepacia]